MRIEFPNAAREDFHWAQAHLRIGSAPENDLVLAASQTSARHLDIEQGKSGWVLRVLPDADRVYVNARPVRERALLRAGDVISVGDCRMLLLADEDPVRRDAVGIPAGARCTVALRAVSGPLSGRLLPVRDSLELGTATQVPIVLPRGDSMKVTIAWRDGSLMLETPLPSAHHPVRVNGFVASEALLQPGDQIGMAMHRFVIDGPGMEPEPEWELPAVDQHALPEEVAGPVGEVWWLIVTAAVLALGIALVLLIRF